jgi:hypothetical protein
MSRHRLHQGRGAGNRQQTAPHADPVLKTPGYDNASVTALPHNRQSHSTGSSLTVQNKSFVPQHFPFQPLPAANGPAPYRFDLSQLLHPDAVQKITAAGKMVFHSVGDTGDYRGKEMDFVAAMMTADYDNSADNEVPAFFYHLGDVVYFAGDVDKYGDNFYETYAEYPALIVAIPGNHDCQPDDPQDGPVDPNKVPLDGFVQNFMSDNPARLGSLKTTSSRTQMNLPNVYWTFTTPFATIIGLFSNVSETEAELHQDQIDWFVGELKAADPNKALIVAIHHPPYSGDTEHSGSTVSEHVLFSSFSQTGVYPHLVLSGHVHNYQRFTVNDAVNGGTIQVPCIVAGNGGYSKLGKLQKVNGEYPSAPLQLTDSLTLENYDDENFGFVRFEVTADSITGRYYSAPYAEEQTPDTGLEDQFTIDLKARTVTTGR